MGVYKGEVVLEEYNERWKDEYEVEKKQISELLGNVALEIEHIGSTSVEGLIAKPIIDIAVGVSKLADFSKVRDRILENGNYTLKEEANDEILVRKEKEDYVFCFIHVMEIDSSRYTNAIIFRDYLRQHEDARNEYAKLKQKLAEKYKDDRPNYTKNKTEFISNIILKALDEKNNIDR